MDSEKTVQSIHWILCMLSENVDLCHTARPLETMMHSCDGQFIRTLKVLSTSLALVFIEAGIAAALPPVDAERILIRQDCSALSDSCFEDTDEAAAWTFGTRNPSAAAPLVWDIGAGAFPGNVKCLDGGYVTFRGAGRTATKLVAEQTTQAALTLKNCQDVTVQDLTITGPSYVAYWIGTGNSTWVNVDLISEPPRPASAAAGHGWYDECGGATYATRSIHYFFGVRVRSSGYATPQPFAPSAFLTSCTENWFYGGEILTEIDSLSPSGDPMFLKASAVHVTSDPTGGTGIGDLRVFGSTIRTVLSNEFSGIPPIYTASGVRIEANGVFHMHGGIVNATATPAATGLVDMAGIIVTGNGFAHAPDTAFVVKPGVGGVARRLVNSGTGQIDSPFFWQARTTPPTLTAETGPFGSEDGEDVFVETDCASSGNCDAAGDEPHLMIYAVSRCGSADPWFDVVTGRCRNDTTP